MKLESLLEKLSERQPSRYPFLSIYLNAEPNEHGRDDFDVFLKKQLSIHEDRFEGEQLESFEKDLKRIRDFASSIDASSDGVAIFACGGEDFFETAQFDVAVDDQFFVADRPFVLPLARLREQNPKYAVVIADTNEARIHVFRRKRAIETEEIENFKTNRTEQGGWSQARYQRHIDNFHLKHAKEVVEELDKIVRDEDISQIVLVGDESVIIPLLKEQLTPYLEEKIVGTLRLNVDTPVHELVEESEKAVEAYDSVTDNTEIDALLEENYDEGLGVTGVANVFAALANGQVNKLYIAADPEAVEYDEAEVSQVMSAYSASFDSSLPEPDRKRLVLDQLVRLGLDSAEVVRFIEDDSLLADHGGVGALLRYRSEGDIVRAAKG